MFCVRTECPNPRLAGCDPSRRSESPIRVAALSRRSESPVRSESPIRVAGAGFARPESRWAAAAGCVWGGTAEWHAHREIYAARLLSAGPCCAFEPGFPVSRILSSQVTARGSARFPGHDSVGCTDLHRRVASAGIEPGTARPRCINLLRACRSAVCADSGVVCSDASTLVSVISCANNRYEPR